MKFYREFAIALGVLCATMIQAQEPTSRVVLEPTSAPALTISNAESPERPKPAANALLVASITGKLVGLSFNAVNLRDIITRNNIGDFAIIAPPSPIVGVMPAIGWSFAAVTGGAAYIVDDSSVKPWMFYTEVAAYGAIGAGLGAAALYAGLSEEGNSANAAPLGVRSGIFLSASAAAGVAAHLLKKSRQE
jgi:hypothetical protein